MVGVGVGVGVGVKTSVNRRIHLQLIKRYEYVVMLTYR